MRSAGYGALHARYEGAVIRELLCGAHLGLGGTGTAQALSISQKTVSRHLANLFAKIGVSSRTAAAAWPRNTAYTE